MAANAVIERRYDGIPTMLVERSGSLRRMSMMADAEVTAIEAVSRKWPGIVLDWPRKTWE